MSLDDLGLELVVRLYRLTPAILTLLPPLLVGVWARRRIQRAFVVASGVDQTFGSQSASQVVRAILEREGLPDRVVSTSGRDPLATFYDPARRELRLAAEVADGHAPALVGLAAHEAGHALQRAQGFAPIRLRTPLVFASGIGARASWVLIAVGAFLDYPELAQRGVWLYAGAVIASLALVPIEIDANRRLRRSLTASSGEVIAREIEPGLRIAVWDHVAATLPWSRQPASASLVRGPEGA